MRVSSISSLLAGASLSFKLCLAEVTARLARFEAAFYLACLCEVDGESAIEELETELVATLSLYKV